MIKKENEFVAQIQKYKSSCISIIDFSKGEMQIWILNKSRKTN